MDFRRADPRYVNFVPLTCVDAIDLFNRHRSLGLSAALYPECFVHCARKLSGTELDMFHRFIICPGGDIAKGGEKPTAIDQQLEVERLQLAKEAEMRDLEMPPLERTRKYDTRPMSLESISESPTQPMSQDGEVEQDDEKEPMSQEYINITTSQ